MLFLSIPSTRHKSATLGSHACITRPPYQLTPHDHHGAAASRVINKFHGNRCASLGDGPNVAPALRLEAACRTSDGHRGHVVFAQCQDPLARLRSALLGSCDGPVPPSAHHDPSLD